MDPGGGRGTTVVGGLKIEPWFVLVHVWLFHRLKANGVLECNFIPSGAPGEIKNSSRRPLRSVF